MVESVAQPGVAGAAPATRSEELFHGQPCYRLALANGESVLVAQHGAHVVSWVSGRRERLFLSPNTVWDGRAAIRGGIPVCFPQFNQRGDLPKHGFVRKRPWALLAAEADDSPTEPLLKSKPVIASVAKQSILASESITDGTPRRSAPRDDGLMQALPGSLRFAFSANDSTRAIWPAEFEARLQVDLQPGQLRVTLEVRNLGMQAFSFSGALHSYLAVSDIAHVHLSGLGGQKEWDALADTHQTALESLQCTGPFDRVYSAPHAPMHLHDPAGGLEISNSEGWADCVVWNPGAAGCAGMADMTPKAYENMLCVEAAQVFEPITVAPGAQWHGSQVLRAVGA
jgi:glucose-6-phosphate 1-epimerase